MLSGVPHQVIALNGDDDVILKNTKGDTVLASVSDTQPIHITASLLKQMGWLGDSSYLYLYS